MLASLVALKFFSFFLFLCLLSTRRLPPHRWFALAVWWDFSGITSPKALALVRETGCAISSRQGSPLFVARIYWLLTWSIVIKYISPLKGTDAGRQTIVMTINLICCSLQRIPSLPLCPFITSDCIFWYLDKVHPPSPLPIVDSAAVIRTCLHR